MFSHCNLFTYNHHLSHRAPMTHTQGHVSSHAPASALYQKLELQVSTAAATCFSAR